MTPVLPNLLCLWARKCKERTDSVHISATVSESLLLNYYLLQSTKPPLAKKMPTLNKPTTEKTSRNKSVKLNPYRSGSVTTERPCIGQTTNGWMLALVRLAEIKSSYSISSEYTVGFKSHLAMLLWSSSKKLNTLYSTMRNTYSAIGMSPSKLGQK